MDNYTRLNGSNGGVSRGDDEDIETRRSFDHEGDLDMVDDVEHKVSKKNSKLKNGGLTSNILKFYPYANQQLTRSIGRLNLSLSNVNLPGIGRINTDHQDGGFSGPNSEEILDGISDHKKPMDFHANRWSPFNDGRPTTPVPQNGSSKHYETQQFSKNEEVLALTKSKTSTCSSESVISQNDTIFNNKENELVSSSSAYIVAKPDQSVFMSSGLMSKMDKSGASNSNNLSIPETPVKKSPLIENHPLSNSSLYHQSTMNDESFDGTNITNIGDSATQNTSIIIQSPRAKVKFPQILVRKPSSSFDNKPAESISVRSDSANSSPQYHTNRYKKVKKQKNLVIFQNDELTNSIQQFTDDLYGPENTYSPTPSHPVDSRFYSDHTDNTTPTRQASKKKSDQNDNFSTYRRHSYYVSPVKARRTINAKIATNPDEHLFERFKNVSLTGYGQFSKVYQVTFGPTKKKYAVKSLQLNKYNSLKRILQEIKLLSDITKHSKNSSLEGGEYIIDFISSWKHQDCFYVMTEYCENGNLDSFLQEQVIAKNTRLEDWRIWKMIVELSSALRFIHDACSIVHLDVKPANILITFEGNLKLGDFGMATELPLKDTSFENEGDREYIAPEIISDSIYDYKADIFSLGLLIVEIAANVVLPDNGYAWHKLRSGDLSDAGKLSSTDIRSNSIFSNRSKVETNLTDCLDYEGHHTKNRNTLTLNNPQIPAWVPRFLIDGESLERMVKWMIEPDYKRRPSAKQLLDTEECQYVEMTRKAGAVIQEDDYGPKPSFFTFE